MFLLPARNLMPNSDTVHAIKENKKLSCRREAARCFVSAVVSSNSAVFCYYYFGFRVTTAYD